MMLLAKKIVSPMMLPLIFVCCVIISMWVSLFYIETNAKENIHKSLNSVLQITQKALQLWVSSRLDDLTDFAKNPALTDLSTRLLDQYNSGISTIDSPALQKIRTLMSKKMRRRDDLAFFIIAPNRVNIASEQDLSLIHI